MCTSGNNLAGKFYVFLGRLNAVMITVADSECARRGGVSHILAEKGVFSPRTGGGGRTPGTPYAGSATGLCCPLFST